MAQAAIEALESLRAQRAEFKDARDLQTPGLLDTLKRFILAESEPYIRRDAVRALGGIRDGRSLSILGELTHREESSAVLTAAVVSIAEQGGRPAALLLLDFIGRRKRPADRWLRQVASNSLVKMVISGDESLRQDVLPRLRQRIGSSNSFERMNAVAILGIVGDRGALPDLARQRERELGDRSPESQYVLRELDATISHLERLR